jgi:hypothetical protein
VLINVDKAVHKIIADALVAAGLDAASAGAEASRHTSAGVAWFHAHHAKRVAEVPQDERHFVLESELQPALAALDDVREWAKGVAATDG